MNVRFDGNHIRQIGEVPVLVIKVDGHETSMTIGDTLNYTDGPHLGRWELIRFSGTEALFAQGQKRMVLDKRGPKFHE